MNTECNVEIKNQSTRRINLRMDYQLAEELHWLHEETKLTQSAIIRIGLKNLIEEVKLYGKVELSV